MEQSQLIGLAEQFNEKINTINSQFFSALDDYKKYYVYYNKNPEVNEFQNYYDNSKSQLQNMSKDLFLTTNNIYKSIETLDKNMANIKIQLNNEKKKITELMELNSNLKNTHNGSEILIDDSKEKYNQQWTKNIEFALSMIFISIMMKKLFTSNSSVS